LEQKFRLINLNFDKPKMKILNYIISIAVLTLAFYIQSCESTQEQGTQSPSDSTTQSASTIPVTSSDTTQKAKTIYATPQAHRKYNDFARLVAGLSLDGDSRYKKYDTLKAYKEFAGSLERSWTKIDGSRFTKMREWSKTELTEANKDNTDIFYPFSGPDFVNVYTLFPNADNYTLIGLETIIPFPDLDTYNKKMVDNYFFSVAESIEDLLEKSYFLTRRMAKDFQKGKAEGILPALTLFVVRTGNVITNIERIDLDDNGKYTLSNIDSGKTTIRGVKVSFYHPSDNRPRSVSYFRQDASDDGLKKSPNFLKMLQNMPTYNAYFKSASYLLHFPYFTTMRPIVLEKARFILQDDTGMPFKFLTRDKWNITVYGVYDKPIKDFTYMGQRDLKTYYDSLKAINGVKPMPFDLGYHWGTKDNNLIRAIKK
jgi:hypothetical protein